MTGLASLRTAGAYMLPTRSVHRGTGTRYSRVTGPRVPVTRRYQYRYPDITGVEPDEKPGKYTMYRVLSCFGVGLADGEKHEGLEQGSSGAGRDEVGRRRIIINWIKTFDPKP